jgi:prepilin-type processing-associated H-X9-DG protein
LTGPYTAYSWKIFKCPDDIWQCLEGGQSMDRVRSYSMNYCMEGNQDDGAKASNNIPLNACLYSYGGLPRYGYRKWTDLGRHGPAVSDAWVICDEHPDTMNNGCIAWGSVGGGWADMPASYHSKGCNFSFADGHVEHHKWLSGYNGAVGICAPVTQQPNAPSPRPGTGNPVDMNWVTSHGTASYP